MRGLVGGVGVDRPGQLGRLIGDYRDRVAAEMCQRTDDRRPEPRLDLHPVGVVEDHVEDRAHVIDPPVLPGDDVEQLRGGSQLAGRVVEPRRRVRPCAGGEVGQVAPDLVERRLVGLGEVVDHTAAQCDIGSTEILFRDLLSGGLFDHRGTGGEDRALSAHDGEVAHRGDQRPVTGRGTQHRRDRGHLAGTLRLGDQVGGAAAVVLAAGPKAGAFEQHDQRNLLAQSQFRETEAFGVAARADRTGQGGEVLGAHHHRGPVDTSGAGDDAVGGDLTTDQGAELLEGPRVEQMVDAGARVELALRAMSGQALVATHLVRVLPPTTQVVQRLLPVLRVAHRYVLTAALTILNCLL